jgi:hypothetical protein
MVGMRSACKYNLRVLAVDDPQTVDPFPGCAARLRLLRQHPNKQGVKMRELEQAIEEFCKEIDSFSKHLLTIGTPLHKFQQELINAAEIYRQGETTQCEHSGIEWDKDGKVVGVNP